MSMREILERVETISSSSVMEAFGEASVEEVAAWKKRSIVRVEKEEEAISAILINDMDRPPKSIKLVRNKKEESETSVIFDLKVNGKEIGSLTMSFPNTYWGFGPAESYKYYGISDDRYSEILNATVKKLGYGKRSIK